MADTALVIMARYPEKGKTKTRLAHSIGDEEAVSLYQAFLTDLAFRFAGQTDYDIYWAYSPPELDFASIMNRLAPSLAQYMHYFPQEGADLGARLYAVFKETQRRGIQQTIVIGSDSPHLSVDLVTSARQGLQEADVVLGPSDDGGYYLIAMREPHDVFSGIPMSTSVVTEMTIEMAKRQGLKVQLLDSCFDVDEFPDLLRLAEVLHRDVMLAPATAAHIVSRRSLYDTNHNASRNATPLDLHRTDQPV